MAPRSRVMHSINGPLRSLNLTNRMYIYHVMKDLTKAIYTSLVELRLNTKFIPPGVLPTLFSASCYCPAILRLLHLMYLLTGIMTSFLYYTDYQTFIQYHINQVYCSFKFVYYLGLELAIDPPPPRGNFVNYNFLKLHYIRHKIKDVSPLRVAALS